MTYGEQRKMVVSSLAYKEHIKGINSFSRWKWRYLFLELIDNIQLYGKSKQKLWGRKYKQLPSTVIQANIYGLSFCKDPFRFFKQTYIYRVVYIYGYICIFLEKQPWLLLLKKKSKIPTLQKRLLHWIRELLQW